MTVTYRDATVADLPAIDALFRRSFTDTFAHLYSAANLATFLAQFTPEAWAGELATMRFRLAERDARVVGFAKLAAVTLPVDPAPHARELRQLYLADEAKGAGVADALLDWAAERSRADGATELYLSVYVDNHRAKRFYRRHGFVDIGPYAFPVGDQIDEDRIMRKPL